MKPRSFYSKYQCDDKLKIYTEAPLNNYQYQKMIENAKPRYMNDYYNTPKYNRRKDEKAFSNLLDNYYTDYKKLKNKYNFDGYEQTQETLPEEENNIDFDYEQFQIKKRNLYSLFLSYDMPDIDEINFDLTDNLINSMYNSKNETLLKNTQTKDDYNSRLNENINDQRYKKEKKNNNNRKEVINNDEQIDNISKNEDSKINTINQDNVDEIFYLDDENQENYEDNYLKVKYNDKYNSEEFPILEDIINSKYDKEFEPPTYEIPNSFKIKKKKRKLKKPNKENKENKETELKKFEDMIINNNYPLFEQLIDPYYPTEYVPPKCFPLENEEKINKNEDEEYEEEEDDYEFAENINRDIYNENEEELNNDEEDINDLKIINNQKLDGNDLILFDNIISKDFKGKYIIPSYKMPNYIKKEIEKEEKKRKEEKKDYEKNKKQNVINTSKNGDNKMLNNIMREDENPKVDDIINSNNKKIYNPPLAKSENEEKESQNENDRYSDGDFIHDSILKNENDIKENTVENIINKNNKENYSIPKYSKPNSDENINYESKEDYMNYNNSNGKDLKTTEDMIKKDFIEEDQNKLLEKNEDTNKKLKESINNNDNYESIVVDDLNDVEDNEENYGI